MMWLEDIEDNAMEQVKNLTNLPFAKKLIALMPDCHSGYGMPIGGVLATKGVIIPNAVGVDIGCGMCAVKTSLTDIDTDTLKDIMGRIRKVVPVGFRKHKEKQDIKLMPGRSWEQTVNMDKYTPIVEKEFNNALKSLGTLGGGNHFIEIQKGDDGFIWIMIHSGSRNLGKQVADHYNNIAIKLNEKWFSQVPTKWELAFLPVDTEEGQSYIYEMNYCVEFALANRELMMSRVMQCFRDALGLEEPYDPIFDKPINIAHNYARQENHFGENLWIHRKGATSARVGELGIIPGSMGTKSYIVEGLGNKLSFESCSHGAGRVMGRKEAIRTLDLKKEQEIMKDVLGKPRSQEDLEEAPSAYKDIDMVMENQKDLVKTLVELKPLAVIKG